MIKRSFFGLAKPSFEYKLLPDKLPEPEKITSSENVTLLLNAVPEQTDKTLSVKEGDKIQTGQKLFFTNDNAYITSSVTGTISSISSFTGDFGASYTAVSINVSDTEEIEEQFKKYAKTPSIEAVKDFLAYVPGHLPINLLFNPEKPIKTIVISGCDNDLLVYTNQYIVKTAVDSIKSGIEILKNTTGADDIMIVLPRGLKHEFGHIDAKISTVDTCYPAASPHLIIQKILPDGAGGKKF